ncbi:MAG: 4-hydroxythreonine-4-phosphate dehydrogenase PdxA [Chitinispirillales bacterium]|jgi:4-hydroxythreonine-4-phosphate dehydrogenase|nr:4-hydroxythreonine-4-phosphate dehydrogenase PdxA [Chitinispirillales bacterium]
MKNTLPLLLTMGDPAGVGPQIAVESLLRGGLDCNVVVVGDVGVMRRAAAFCSLPAAFNVLEGEDGDFSGVGDGVINIINVNAIDASDFAPGKPQANCGRAAYQYIIKAIEIAMAGRAAGVVTNPISKESLKMAGIDYPGHTEIFADKTGVGEGGYSMVFLLDGVAVAHVTTHVSLRNAINMITKERVLAQIRLLHRSLKSLGLDPPRMAVSGLNPHAGENGLFGDEEIKEIIPAINAAKAEGIDAAGPLPPDTVFNRAFKGEFNGVISMLHDHGFVALKSRDFDRGVNITVGLPIIRTSVGHGTAFDIAWKSKASCGSLESAVRVALALTSKD